MIVLLRGRVTVLLLRRRFVAEGVATSCPQRIHVLFRCRKGNLEHFLAVVTFDFLSRSKILCCTIISFRTPTDVVLLVEGFSDWSKLVAQTTYEVTHGVEHWIKGIE